MKLWTVLSTGRGGGWVMGVYDSQSKAHQAANDWESQNGAAPLRWHISDLNPEYSETEANDGHYIVTSYNLNEPFRDHL